MVAVTMLRAGELDTPYAYFQEDDAWVRHHNSLLYVYKAKHLGDIEKFL